MICATTMWVDYFESRAIPEPNTGCWLWEGSVTNWGYGTLSYAGTNLKRAHRLSWFLAHGEIPPGAHVLHKCDVPCCVNPDHLFLGNHTDNMRDMARKGRGGKSGRPGELNPQAKLTNRRAKEIRQMAKARICSQNELARKLGLSPMTISRLARGISYND